MLVSPTDKQSPRRYIDQSRREAPAQVWLLIPRGRRNSLVRHISLSLCNAGQWHFCRL